MAEYGGDPGVDVLALNEVGHLGAAEREGAAAAGAVEGEVADGLADVSVHERFLLEEGGTEAILADVLGAHGDGLGAVGGLDGE